MDSTTTAPAGSMTTSPGPLTAHLTSATHSGASYTPPKGIHLGRERVNWSPEVWERIDRAVHHETIRSRVAAKFLPIHRVDPHTTTVPSDTILSTIGGSPFLLGALGALGAGVSPVLNVDEAATTRLIETWVEFSMTAQQVEQENQHKVEKHDQHDQLGEHDQPGDHHPQHAHYKHHGYSTGVTLAVRSANTLCLAQDTVLFQGQNAFPLTAVPGALTPSILFTSQIVQNRGTPTDWGLLNIGATTPLPAGQNVTVPLPPPGGAGPVPAQYSEHTVAAINKAYSILQDNGHYGPYACVLYFYPYADSYAPLPTTLILPADRINPLMTEGYFGTGAMNGAPTPQNPQQAATMPNPPILPAALQPGSPGQPQSVGIVVSTGGNTMDLVIGQDPVTAFMQVDANGNYRFRVLERFALRPKDLSAVVRLEFQ